MSKRKAESQVRKYRKTDGKKKGNYGGRFQKSIPKTGELKFFDTAISFTVDATAEVPATGQLTLIPQGVTDATRVGRKCTIKSVYINGSVSFVPGATATAAMVMHLYIMLDKQANGAAATVSGDSGIFTGTNLSSALQNLSNAGRFQTLRHIIVTLNPAGGVASAWNIVIEQFSAYIRCNLPIEYDASAATGAITTIRSNNIFLVAGGAGTNFDDNATVTANARLRFSDN